MVQISMILVGRTFFVFFSFFAKNGLKFFVFREKLKNERFATHSKDAKAIEQKILYYMLYIVELDGLLYYNITLLMYVNHIHSSTYNILH